MFAGQGAQYFKMGEALYREHGAFRASMDRLDQAAAPYVDRSIVETLYGPEARISDPFDQLTLSHPALFMVQVSMAEALRADGMPEPDLLLGLSLGEFVAAAVGGAAPAATMLVELIKQARLFENLADPGAMLMVLDDVAKFETDPIYGGRAELAGVNFDRCFILSGTDAEIRALSRDLDARDVANQILPIGHAFHSSAIDPMEPAYREATANRDWQPSRIPVVGCSLQEEGTLPDWWRVVRAPIRFDQAFRRIDQAHPAARYVDLGPAGSMKTNCQYCTADPSIRERSFAIMTPYANDLQNLDKLRAALGSPAARVQGAVR